MDVVCGQVGCSVVVKSRTNDIQVQVQVRGPCKISGPAFPSPIINISSLIPNPTYNGILKHGMHAVQAELVDDNKDWCLLLSACKKKRSKR